MYANRDKIHLEQKLLKEIQEEKKLSLKGFVKAYTLAGLMNERLF